MRHQAYFLRPALIAGVILCGLVPGLLLGQERDVPADALAKKAEVVAVGKVTGLKAEWDQNRIVTRVTMTVGEYLKGGAGSVMTITSPGGEVDGVGEWYSHTARFAKDEEVVVFAEKDRKGNLRVTGGNEGKISIKKDASSGMSRVSDRVSLDDFKARIKESVRAQEIK
jgi:hypothetical protein